MNFDWRIGLTFFSSNNKTAGGVYFWKYYVGLEEGSKKADQSEDLATAVRWKSVLRFFLTLMAEENPGDGLTAYFKELLFWVKAALRHSAIKQIG